VKESAMCWSGTVFYFVVGKMVKDLSFYIKDGQTVATAYALIEVKDPFRTAQ
jgi:hypothetical protein